MNLARKYRPQKLSEVIGQNSAVKILRELALRRTDLCIILLAGQWGIGKCITGDMPLLVDGKWKPIESLYRGEEPGQLRLQKMNVEGIHGSASTLGFYFGGEQPTLDVALATGHSVSGTYNHPILVQTPEGLSWKSLFDVEVGDRIALLGGESVEKPHLNPDIYYCGYCIGDGSYNYRDRLLVSGSRENLESLLILKKFGDEKFYQDKRRKDLWTLQTRAGRQFLQEMGFVSAVASNKSVPSALMQGGVSVYWSLLAGLFDSDGCIQDITYSTMSRQLAGQVQMMLQAFGVHSRVELKRGTYKGSEHFSHRVILSKFHLRSLGYGFGVIKSWDEQVRMSRPNTGARNDCGVLKDDLFAGLINSWRSRFSLKKNSEDAYHFDNLKNRKFGFLRETLLWLVSNPDYAPLLLSSERKWLDFYLRADFGVVSKKTDGGKRRVYDLSQPETQSFVAGGILNHNTTLARLYAKLINCEHPIENDVCDGCKSCESMAGASPRHPDYSERDMGCVAEGTPVLTPTGYTRIENQRPGALVMSFTGNEAVTDTVSKVWSGRSGPGVRVRTRYGLDIVASPEHEFRVWRKTPGGRLEDLGFLATSMLQAGYYLVRPAKVRFQKAAGLLTAQAAAKRAYEEVKGNLKWKVKSPQLPSEMSSELAWLIGFADGDGSTPRDGRGVHFYVTNKVELRRIEEGMSSLFGLEPKKYVNAKVTAMEYDSRVLAAYWVSLSEIFLSEFGYYFKDYLGGLAQADGTSQLGGSAGALCISTVKKSLCDQVALMGMALGCKVQVGVRTRPNIFAAIRGKGKAFVTEWRVLVSGSEEITFDTLKCNGGTDLSKRGWIKKEDIVLARIEGVEDAGIVNYYDLTVRGCPAYLPGCVYTHNSSGLVADIRRLKDEATMKPSWKRRIFTLDEIQGASKEAFNALLKILEEPPSSAAVVMCTTALNQVPYAIVSRSLVIMLDPLTPEQMRDKLVEVADKENVQADSAALAAIASYSSGSMRDCYMTFERLQVLGAGHITMEVLAQEPWFVSSKLSNGLVLALVKQDKALFESTVRSLTSRVSYESLLREALRKLCRHYISKGKRADVYTDALWRAYLRVRRGADPDLSMDGLWTECTK